MNLQHEIFVFLMNNFTTNFETNWWEDIQKFAAENVSNFLYLQQHEHMQTGKCNISAKLVLLLIQSSAAGPTIKIPNFAAVTKI